MVFKRPGGSRNDKSGSSSNRANGANDRPKRSASPIGKSDKDFDKPKKNQSSFSGERGGSKRPSSAAGKKSYTGRPASGDDRPARESFSRDTDKEGGEKRPYSSPRSRPYSGRPSDGESKPKREYKSRDNRESGEKRFSSDKPRTTRSGSGERNFSSDKPRTPRSASVERKFGTDKPRTSRSASGEGKFETGGPRSSRPAQGDRKFTGKRSTDNFKAKPFRKERDTRSEFSDEPAAPAKTMRGRKEKEGRDDLIRLNRYIANAGICSRRKADELIEAGVISVNGNVISELGFKVNPMKDEIRYNGELLKREKMVYVLLNKPKDYITTTDDPQERRTVMHLVEKASRERIYPIGRLDRNTTGLLLMTNDGDLAEKLSHPRSNVTKLYQVELSKSLTQGDLNKISFGVELEDGLIKPDAVSYVQGGTKREVGIQIHSGKNRIVRRIFEHLGYEVVKLDRVVYANLTKKDLPRGRWRYLDEKEVIQLKHLI